MNGLSNDLNPDDFKGNEADKNLLVKFYHKSVLDKAQTKEKGHPVHVDKEYIEIRVPGKRDPQTARPATHADKMRFPDHYDRFKNRVSEPETGWPLSEWAAVPRSFVETLAFHNIKTVAQLAGAPDSALAGIMGGMSYKQKAMDALESAGNSAEIAAKQQEMEAENKQLKAKNQELEAKVDKLTERMDKLLDKLAGEDDNKEDEAPAPEAEETETEQEIAPSALDEDTSSDETEKTAEAETAEEASDEEKPAKKRRSRAKK